MDELVIRLNLQAMQAMAAGHELVIDVDGVRVCMRCDDETVEAFSDSVQKALLHQLPAMPGVH